MFYNNVTDDYEEELGIGRGGGGVEEREGEKEEEREGEKGGEGGDWMRKEREKRTGEGR